MNDLREEDLAATARAIIDANIYLTLATAGPDGTPWACPVFYATADATDFYWLSSPLTRHSRSIAARPRVSLLIFDSTRPAGTGEAVYITADATEVADDEGIAAGLAVYPGAPERGGRPVGVERVREPSPLRLYRATAVEYSVLCPFGDDGCLAHGERYDHRIEVKLAGG